MVFEAVGEAAPGGCDTWCPWWPWLELAWEECAREGLVELLMTAWKVHTAAAAARYEMLAATGRFRATNTTP